MILLALLITLATYCLGIAQVQGDCVLHDHGLTWLASSLSSDSVIACLGSSLQQYNADRYWGEQYGKNASVVVFPASTQDVSFTVIATSKSPLGQGYAIVGGAHGQTNASSSYNFVIDLSFLNTTTIISDYGVDNTSITAIAYQGGAKWIDVMDVTAESGFTAVGARVSSVGVGGFSTGGGIGFLAGAYGYAIDRLRAMEVVLPCGDIVLATSKNQYSDLFWALQGGGGQFGIVTTFYQEAAPEPTVAIASLYLIDSDSNAQAQENTVKFFNTHADPFSLMYYASGFLPADPLQSPVNDSSFAVRTVILTIYLGDPAGGQLSATETFADLLTGLDVTLNTTFTVPYADLTEVVDPFFPYGFRRGFWGAQTTNITTSYLQTNTDALAAYVDKVLARGEFPASALWALQYMSPGLNGHLPASDAATGWPHAIAGHQTLFSPAWSLASDDGLAFPVNHVFDQITHTHQASTGPFIADYPNYISPNASGHRVWGANVARLERVKQKYDPECAIHNGRVFGSATCKEKGLANIFA